jgi:hypothetical protein
MVNQIWRHPEPSNLKLSPAFQKNWLTDYAGATEEKISYID